LLKLAPMQPLLGRYATALLPELKRRIDQGALSMHGLLNTCPPGIIAPPDFGGRLYNINRRDDLPPEAEGRLPSAKTAAARLSARASSPARDSAHHAGVQACGVSWRRIRRGDEKRRFRQTRIRLDGVVRRRPRVRAWLR